MDSVPAPFAPNEKIAQLKGQCNLFFQELRIFPQGRTVPITLPPESSLKQHNIHLIKYQQDVLEQSYERGKVIPSQVDQRAQQVQYQFFISMFWLEIKVKFIPHKFQYPMDQCIGAGGFGKCYVVQENKESPKRCMKVIRFKKSQVRYFEIMSTVRQVGICKLLGFLGIGPFIYDVGGFDFLVFDNCICYYMKLCEPLVTRAEDLKQHADNQSYRQEFLQSVKKDLVQNIYLLHSLKLVHRDIKPENILYSKEQKKYVFCDFGMTHSVQQNWDQRTHVKEVGGTPGYMCEEMQTLLEKLVKGQKMNPQQRRVNLYYNDQFALQRTLKSISEIESEESVSFMNKEIQTRFEKQEKRQKVSFQQRGVILYQNDLFALQMTFESIKNEIESEDFPAFMFEEMQTPFEKLERRQKMSPQQEMVNLYQNSPFVLQRILESITGNIELQKSAILLLKPSVVGDVWSRYSEYFERYGQEVPLEQKIQFLKGAYGCTLPLLMCWQEHIYSLEGQQHQLQKEKYREYIVYFKIPYFREQLDKLEILVLQRGIADKVQQQSDAFLIYCYLIIYKCKDPKLLLRCLQYITSNNIISIFDSPYSPIPLKEVEQGLLNAIMKALNYLQEHLDSPGNSMQQQFFTLRHTLVLGDQPYGNTLQQLSGKYASSAEEFTNLIRQFQSPQHLEELLSLSEIAVYCFLKRNTIYKELLQKQSHLTSRQQILKMQKLLHTPFDQFMQLKRRGNRYYELPTLKLYCKAFLIYSQHKLSAREVIPQLLQEAEEVYDGLYKRDPSYSYTPEAGILNMFRGTVYKLIPQKREYALECSFEALKRIGEHYGEGNYYIPQIKKNIAQILQELGGYKTAKQFYVEAVHPVLTGQDKQLRTAAMMRRGIYDMNIKMGQFEGESLQLISENQYRKFLDLVRTSPQEALRYVQVQLQLYYNARRWKGMENQEQRLAIEFVRFLSRERSFFRYNSFDQFSHTVSPQQSHHSPKKQELQQVTINRFTYYDDE